MEALPLNEHDIGSVVKINPTSFVSVGGRTAHKYPYMLSAKH